MDHSPNNQIPLNVDDWFYFDQDYTTLYRDDDTLQFFKLLDMNRVTQLKYDQDYVSELGFTYFDPIDEYLSVWDDGNLPLLSDNNNDHISGESEVVVTTVAGDGGGDEGERKMCRRSRPLELEEIEQHFELPIALAAEKLKVGLTMLKKRCRELNIKRWPHRKLKSIKSLIQNAKEMGLNEEIQMLEEQKKMIKKLPAMDFTQKTKKLRQACFKARYKKRRLDSPSLSLNHL